MRWCLLLCPIIMLYTLNLHTAVCQLCQNKNGRENIYALAPVDLPLINPSQLKAPSFQLPTQPIHCILDVPILYK